MTPSRRPVYLADALKFMATEHLLTLTGLFIYPVKSCRGIPLTEAELTTRGLARDREWMVVDPNGRFLTQRDEPRMARISTELSATALILRAPGLPTLQVPLEHRPGTRRTVQVWRDTLNALDEGAEAADWFSRALGRTLFLVRYPEEFQRLSNREWTGDVEAENRFSDAYPILVISEESLEDLNRRIEGDPLPMERFRTNLVIAGGPAYIEDVAPSLGAPGIELRLVKPCTRCSITATHHLTGEVGVEPLKTLARYRRSERPSGVVFGQNALLIRGAGLKLRLGTVFAATTP